MKISLVFKTGDGGSIVLTRQLGLRDTSEFAASIALLLNLSVGEVVNIDVKESNLFQVGIRSLDCRVEHLETILKLSLYGRKELSHIVLNVLGIHPLSCLMEFVLSQDRLDMFRSKLWIQDESTLDKLRQMGKLPK